MLQYRFGKECERCRQKFRNGDQLYLARLKRNTDKPHRFTTFLLCTDCSELNASDYIFFSHVLYLRGVGR